MKPLLTITLLGMLAFGQEKDQPVAIEVGKSTGSTYTAIGGKVKIGKSVGDTVNGVSAKPEAKPYYKIVKLGRGSIAISCLNGQAPPHMYTNNDGSALIVECPAEEPKLECTTDGKTANAPCSAEEPAKTKLRK